LIDACSFMLTANPPGSSIGELKRRPLASRSNDFCNSLLFLARFIPALAAAVLVDIFSDMLVISYG
jgi:hypothetical protein